MKEIMMGELTAEERAKRALDYSLPFPGDEVEHWDVPSDLEGMVEPEGMPTTRTIDAVGRIVKEIREAQREVMKEITHIFNSAVRLPPREALLEISREIRTLIKQLEEKQ